MPTTYYAAFDDTMAPLGLFQVVTDDEAETQVMSYMTADGTWKPDPTVIDELHEPGVEIVPASDVPDIVDALTGGKGAEAVAQPEDPDAESMPVPGQKSQSSSSA